MTDRRKFFSALPLIAATLVACTSLPPVEPVQAAGTQQLQPGPIPEGTIYVRNIRGRILFSAPSKDFWSGQEIRIHAYEMEAGRLHLTIENERGVVVNQAFRGLHGVSVGLGYIRSYGGFKIRDRERVDFPENS